MAGLLALLSVSGILVELHSILRLGYCRLIIMCDGFSVQKMQWIGLPGPWVGSPVDQFARG